MIITLPSSCSLGVSTPYLATFSEVTLFEWLSGLLMPDMCDIARPTWLDDDDEAEEAPVLDDKLPVAKAVDDDDATTPDPVSEPSLPPSLVLRGVVDKRAVSESSTRSDGKSNSCCLSVEAQRKIVNETRFLSFKDSNKIFSKSNLQSNYLFFKLNRRKSRFRHGRIVSVYSTYLDHRVNLCICKWI